MTTKMRMPKVKLKAPHAKHWLPYAFYGGVVLLLGWLLWWQLGSLTQGYSSSELTTYQTSANVRTIFDHPLNAPFTLLVHMLMHIKSHSLLALRITSTIFGLVTLSSFYWLVRYWHGQRAAILGTILFGTSAWFLHTVRLGEPNVLLFGLLSLTACSVWFKHSGRSFAIVLCLALAAVLLYVPGMLWFILAGMVWQWKTIDRIFKKHLWVVTLGGALLLAIVTPLGLAIYHTPHVAKELLGLPTAGWPQPFAVLRHLAEVPLQLIFRGPAQPEHWLGRIAVLDAFCLAMLFLGLYVYSKHRNLVRTQLLIVILLIGIALIGLNGSVNLSVIIPFIYILIAAGVGLLIDRWYAVFPRNPIAQALALALVSLTVFASCWYGYRQYFVAWPATPETKPLFTVQQIVASATIKK